MPAPAPVPASPNKESAPIRTLIVDDSVVVRTVMERILGDHPDYCVVQKTNMAEHALHYLQEHPVDLVLLDIELPGQSGLAALPAMLQASPRAKVVILSGNCEEGSAAAVEALALGASDIFSKPDSGSFGKHFAPVLLERLSRLFGNAAFAATGSTDLVRLTPPNGATRPLACLGIGASTGGIHALGRLFSGLRRPLGIPILLTQHLPASFTFYFAQQLSRMTDLRVKVAESGELLAADVVYVAPGDANLLCRKGLHGRVAINLDKDRTPSGYLPGVDPMFASMAHAFGAGAAGIVLTGMGRDGTLGARAMVDAGGWIVAQDKDSSVVWGMPGSVAREGLSCALLNPEEIMEYVAQRAGVTA